MACSTDVELLDDLRSDVPIWNLNGPAEYFLEMLFKYRVELQESLEQSRADRHAFEGVLAALPDVAVFAGGGNFVVVRLDPRTWPEDLPRRLVEAHNVYVKDITPRIPRDGHWLRLAVRTPAENARLAALLATYHEARHV